MEILIAALGTLVGAIASWLISHFYYVRNNRVQKELQESHKALYDKLEIGVRELILGDKRDSLSIKELNQLLDSKTLDRESDAKFPYKACPRCGSDNLTRLKERIIDLDQNGELPEWARCKGYSTHVEQVSCGECRWMIRG